MDREQLMRRWWETAYEFAEAVITENQAAVSAMTVPDSEVDLTYRIFGFAPLIFLMKGHLKHPALTASRAAWNRETGEDVRIEVSWINEQGQPARDGQVTFHLQWMQPGFQKISGACSATACSTALGRSALLGKKAGLIIQA